ncbi:F-box domain-containing protein [Mycena chlorophos]|uniref:F-box domain-containing protein n=1 Tax=Mycena chlorophos TaxID=658473 RepID=A0A8H6SSP8_MYCCL|nr:F-box domain-containing protein [Mycena chlorophos]
MCSSFSSSLLPSDDDTETVYTLLRTNGALSDSDTDRLRSFVDGCGTELEKYQVEIEQTTEAKSLARLQAERQTLVIHLAACRSLLTCYIRRLPTEVLLQVLQLAVWRISTISIDGAKPTQSRGLTDLSNQRWLTLSTVCSVWRTIVLSTPSLWSNIPLAGISLANDSIAESLVRRALERSKEVPLDVSIDMGLQYHGHGVHPRKSVTLLAEHSHRWRRLTFYVHPDELGDLSAVHRCLPQLEELRLVYKGGAGNRWRFAACVLFEDAPALRKLMFGCSDMPPALPWEQLEDVHFDLQEGYRIEPLLEVLPRCGVDSSSGCNVTISDVYSSKDAGYTSQKQVSASHITSLHITLMDSYISTRIHDPLADLLAHLDLPALQRLDVGAEYETWFMLPAEALIAFLGRSAVLTSLTLTDGVTSSAQLIAILKQTPLLEELALAEVDTSSDRPVSLRRDYEVDGMDWESDDEEDLQDVEDARLRFLELNEDSSELMNDTFLWALNNEVPYLRNLALLRTFLLFDLRLFARVVRERARLYRRNSAHDGDFQLPMVSSFAGCLEANPDISGLGVRISFYLQTLALVLLAGRSLEEALSSVWTLLGTSFGLAISALVTASQGQLPLYQAIIVTDLIWLANFAIFMALAAYNRHPRGSHVVQYCAIVQTYVSLGCVLFLWDRAGRLDGNGSGAGANNSTAVSEGNTVFVVLFVDTKAEGAGRTVALVMTSLLLAAYSGVAALFLWKRLPSTIPFLRRKTTNSSVSPPPTNPALAPPQPTLAPPPSSARSASSATSGVPSSRHRSRRHHRDHRHSSHSAAAAPPSLPLDPHLSVLTLLFLLPYIITVACTEMQLVRNDFCSGGNSNGTSNNAWGFGQILALTVTIVPVVITGQAFREYGLKQRPRTRDRAGSHSHGTRRQVDGRADGQDASAVV